MTVVGETLPKLLVLLLDALRENPQTGIVFLWVVVAAILDLIWHRISNLLTVGGLIAALMMRFVWQGWDGLVEGLAGFAVAFCIYLPLYAARWMGGGDVKLMAAVGAFLGLACGLIGGGIEYLGGRGRRPVHNRCGRRHARISVPLRTDA